MSIVCGAPEQTIDRSGIPAGETVVLGRVVRDGSPAAGNYVRLLDTGGEFTAEVVTSASGVFRFYTRPGSWTVRVIGPGRPGDRKVEVGQGEVAEVEVSL